MKAKFLLTTVLTAAMLQGCKQAKPVEKIVACGDRTALIVQINPDTQEGEVVWQWNSADAQEQLPAEYQNRLRSLDDCKVVNNGKQLLITSSSDAAVLLDIATKTPLFYAHVPMAHSAEMLPGNRIVVALSTHPQGNSLEVYDADKSEQVLFRDSLYSGHGVVWMDKLQRLYALGFDELRAYTLKNWDTTMPKLELQQTWDLPTEGGHELSFVSSHELLVTDHEGIYIFDTDTQQFTPFAPLEGIDNIKSANYYPATGQVVYTKAEISWWTHHLYSRNPEWIYTNEDIKLYKVRTFGCH